MFGVALLLNLSLKLIYTQMFPDLQTNLARDKNPLNTKRWISILLFFFSPLSSNYFSSAHCFEHMQKISAVSMLLSEVVKLEA